MCLYCSLFRRSEVPAPLRSSCNLNLRCRKQLCISVIMKNLQWNINVWKANRVKNHISLTCFASGRDGNQMVCFKGWGLWFYSFLIYKKYDSNIDLNIILDKSYFKSNLAFHTRHNLFWRVPYFTYCLVSISLRVLYINLTDSIPLGSCLKCLKISKCYSKTPHFGVCGFKC